MAAICKCNCGNIFRSRVIEDSPEINAFEIEDSICPECSNEEFEIIEVDYEYFDDDVI